MEDAEGKLYRAWEVGQSNAKMALDQSAIKETAEERSAEILGYAQNVIDTSREFKFNSTETLQAIRAFWTVFEDWGEGW